MILLILLIIPILFWFIPLSRSQGIIRDELNRLIFNFVSMLATCIFTGILFWYFSLDPYLSVTIILTVSLCWAIVFHFINKRLK